MKRFAAALALVAAPLVTAAQAPRPAPPQLFGIAARTGPVYDGSSDRETTPVPVVLLSAGPFFARTTRGVLEGGLRIEPASWLTLGTQVAFENGRDPEDSDFLKQRGIEELDDAASFGVFAETFSRVGPVPVWVLLRYRRHSDGDRGAQADLRITSGIFASQSFTLNGYAQLTWADSESVRTEYGITPAVAARSGLRPYTPGSGLRHASIGLFGIYNLTRSWALVGLVEGRRLQGDAQDSPLAERSSAAYGLAGVVYRF